MVPFEGPILDAEGARAHVDEDMGARDEIALQAEGVDGGAPHRERPLQAEVLAPRRRAVALDQHVDFEHAALGYRGAGAGWGGAAPSSGGGFFW